MTSIIVAQWRHMDVSGFEKYNWIIWTTFTLEMYGGSEAAATNRRYDCVITKCTQIARFMGPIWGPPGSCRPQMGPMLAPWILLSGWRDHSKIRKWRKWENVLNSLTYICVGSLTITGSDNGFLPGRRQAIIWTIAGILFIGPLGTNFSAILIEFFHSRKCVWKCCPWNGGHFVSASMC